MKLQRENIQDIIKLTPLQKGMLYHYLKNPESAEYCTQLSLDLHGSIDLNLLTATWESVIKNNEMLRCVYRWEETSNPVQIILKTYQFHFDYYNLSTQPDKERAFEVIRAKDQAQKFDLHSVPFRIILCKLAEKQFKMIISNHHILYDGWSTGLILKEFLETYQALADGQSITRSLKTPFKEFIECLENRDKLADARYWKGYLKGFEPQQIADDTAQDTVEENGYYVHHFSEDLTGTLESFSKQNKITLAVMLFCAWGLLLQRYTNSTDVVFGTTVSGRNENLQDIEDIVGLFINTVPLRVRAKDSDKIVDLLSELNNTLKERGPYENTPLLNIREYVGLRQGEELFTTILAIENYHLDQIIYDKQRSIVLDSYSISELTNFDLSVSIAPIETFKMYFAYKKSCLTYEYVRQLAIHFETLLTNILSEPNSTVGSLEMLTDFERRQILYTFNDPVREYRDELRIYQLLERRAEAYPEQVLAVFEDQKLTYRELNQQANQLARLLVQRGVKSETIIGIMLERSLEMLVGIMGIWKAGGAYLPIDPKYPMERIRYILQDSTAHLLMSTTKYLEKSEWTQETVDLTDSSIYQGNADNLELNSRVDQLSYVIYTSGSTGKPKGVMVPEKGVLNRLYWGQQHYPLTEADVVMQKTPFTFDVSVWEMFWWAVSDAKVCFLIPGGEKDPEIILETIAKHQVTVMHFVPSMLNIFLEYLKLIQDTAKFTELSSLKYVFASGEALTPFQVNRFHQLVSYRYNTRLTNLYGPTEGTIEVAYFDCEQIEEYSRVPIGKPVDNIQLFVMNEHNTLQPVGVVGELYIAGVGVTRGYLNHPELTNQRFLPNPFGEGMVYKTGDLARWLADGNIEYLGRLDYQVKIRGNRVELGEITEQLLAHPLIKDAVITAEVERDGMTTLCCYYVCQDYVDGGILRSYLAESLPEYMIPTYYIELEIMPLTDSGKIDQRALPKPQIQVLAQGETGPADELEASLLKIWREVLDVQQLGVHDAFFSMGGHSLKAMALVTRIQRELGLRITLKEFFELTTVYQLAEYMRNQQSVGEPRIPETINQARYPLSSAQKRLYFLQMMNPANTAYNMTQAFWVTGNLEISKLEEVFRQLINRHESLRTTFEIMEDDVWQKISEQVEFQVEVFDGCELEDSQVVSPFVRPFDLQAGPLFRVGVVKTVGDRELLFLDIHHIIADGFSNNILIKEFMDCYAGNELPLIQRSYKDYAVWQQSQKAELSKQKEFWLHEFEGSLPTLELVTDYPRPHIQSQEGQGVQFVFDENLVRELRLIATETHTTLNMILMTAWFTLLHQLTNQDDLIIGTVTTGRNHSDLVSIVGMFVNTLPIRVMVDSEDDFLTVLNQVKDKLLSALDHQDYQYEDLVDDLQLARKLERNPLFDVMFVMQDPDQLTLKLPGVLLEKYGFKQNTAKFDLTLFAVDDGQQIQLELEYCAALFNRMTIERYIVYYQRIVRTISKNILSKIGEIPLLSFEEKSYLLRTINATEREYSGIRGQFRTVQGLFDHQAVITPTNTAIIYEGEKMSYQDLQTKANQLALRLSKFGLKTGDVVGILMEHSPEMIISMLAVLKSGAAYLPIDPDFPEVRQEYMLQDCRCSILLTKTGQKLADFAQVQLLYVDNPDIYRTTPVEQVSKGSADDLIYLIYTSGSTGKPKGCMITQHGVVNYLEWAIKEYFDDIRQVYFPVYSSIAFDLTVTSIYTPLLSGQTINLYPKRMDALQLIVEDGLSNIIKVTPTHLRLLLDLDCQACKLEKIIVGGEQLTTELAGKVLEKFDHKVQIYNEYGPTETVVGAMIHQFDPEKDKRMVVPIGKPIYNTQVYILNQRMEICPPGVIGELYIGGVGVSLGYINQAEITAQAFGADPFAVKPGARLYKTGDLAMYLQNGVIEYVGRRDSQIKIRGYRIELGEIRQAILDYPGIRDTVIVAKGGQADRFICAYIVPEGEVSLKELKMSLAVHLPEYMIPGFFVILDSIPVATGGKVDILALPEPKLQHNEVIEQPLSKVEEELYNLWAANLSIQGFGTRENFFEIGGNSFLVMKIHAQLSKTYPEIKITDFFKYPTIHALAQYIENLDQGRELSKIVLALDFPEEYYAITEPINDTESFSFPLSGELVQRLSDVGVEYGVTIETVITTVYAFLLATLSSQEVVCLQSWLSEENTVLALEITVQDSDLAGLCTQVYQKLSNPQLSGAYKFSDYQLQGRRHNTGIVPLIAKRSMVQSTVDLTRFYDLVLLVGEKAQELIISFEYNQMLLNQVKIEEFVQMFAGLLANIEI